MSHSIKSAIVIGAGVVGVATAYALARRGVSVTIIDQREAAGNGTSFANGGQLSYLYTGPLATHRIRAELPSLALGMNPAFRISLKTDPDFVLWLLAFLRNCTRDRFVRNMHSALELTLESRLAMLNLLQQHELDFDYQVRGKMQLLYTPHSVDTVKETMSLKQADDEDEQMLSPDEMLRIEPALAHAGQKPLAGLWSPGEAMGDANKFSRALLDLLQTEYGVETCFGQRVTRVSLNDTGGEVFLGKDRPLSADLVVLSTGADRALMKQLRLNVPLYPMKGYSITAGLGEAPPEISLTDAKRRLVFTPLGGRMRIAGMADLGVTKEAIAPKRLQVLIDAAKASMPKSANFDDIQNSWAGLRPMTPDSNPRIARPHPALAYALGHGMLGWTMAMGSGERVAKLALPDAE